jgi:hypothetical protein
MPGKLLVKIKNICKISMKNVFLLQQLPVTQEFFIFYEKCTLFLELSINIFWLSDKNSKFHKNSSFAPCTIFFHLKIIDRPGLIFHKKARFVL